MAQTTNATTQAHGGAHAGGGSFPPFDSSTFGSQLIWLALAFGALYLLMSRSRCRASRASWTSATARSRPISTRPQG